jgi:hypothetical protein
MSQVPAKGSFGEKRFPKKAKRNSLPWSEIKLRRPRNPMDIRGEALVAIMNNLLDFAIARDQHWYRPRSQESGVRVQKVPYCLLNSGY